MTDDLAHALHAAQLRNPRLLAATTPAPREAAIVLAPGDVHELAGCLDLAVSLAGSVHLWLGPLEPLHATPPVVRLGRFVPIQPGPGPLAWLAPGPLVRLAVTVSRRWRGSAVWSAPCLRPLAPEAVGALCRRYRAVIVLDEAGFGTTVAALASAQGATICQVPPGDPATVAVQVAEYLRGLARGAAA